MGVQNVVTSEAGLVGVLPNQIYIETDNTYAEVTATGYLNASYKLGMSYSHNQLASVLTTDDGPVQLKVAVSGSNYSLVQLSSPGAVTLPTVADNLIKSSDTAGTLADAAIAVADVQLNTNIIAAQTADIGGAGAGPIAVAVTGLTAASVVVASIVSSSNAVSVAKVTPGTNTFGILFSGDPGAACVVSYVAFVAAQ